MRGRINLSASLLFYRLPRHSRGLSGWVHVFATLHFSALNSFPKPKAQTVSEASSFISSFKQSRLDSDAFCLERFRARAGRSAQA